MVLTPDSSTFRDYSGVIVGGEIQEGTSDPPSLRRHEALQFLDDILREHDLARDDRKHVGSIRRVSRLTERPFSDARTPRATHTADQPHPD